MDPCAIADADAEAEVPAFLMRCTLEERGEDKWTMRKEEKRSADVCEVVVRIGRSVERNVLRRRLGGSGG